MCPDHSVELTCNNNELSGLPLCVQRLGMFGPLRCGEMYALDRLLREARVLEVVRRITKDNPRRLRQPAEGMSMCPHVSPGSPCEYCMG